MPLMVLRHFSQAASVLQLLQYSCGGLMLERFEQVQGVGLLHDANGKPFKWQKATLIYADNGRGKSTLASILRSVTTGDASLIAARSTVDGTLPPSVVLQ